MKKPYLKKLQEISGFKVFYVDGAWIRKNLNEEFTNFGANYLFNFIPKRELWVDKERSKKEWKYFFKYFLEREKAIENGKSINEAREIGNLAEKSERDKNPFVKKLKSLDKEKLVEKIHKKLLKKYSNKIKVWIVKGFLVRSILFLDFTAGGHDKVYSFIPKGEIWIDDAINPKELKFVLIHEAHERNLMSKGMTYEEAHADSSKVEFFCRKNPKKADEILKKELGKAGE